MSRARKKERVKGIWGYRVLLLVIGVLGGIRVHLVGELALSELFCALYFVYFFFTHRDFWKVREYAYVTKLYAGLLAAQVVSEFMVGNEIGNSLRGIAVTIVSFCTLTFYVQMFMKDRGLVAWLLIGGLIAGVLFPSSMEGTAEAALSGDNAAYLKFVIAGRIKNALLIISIFWRVRVMPFVMMFVALVFVVAGARSAGLALFFAGVVSWFFLSGRQIKMSKAKIRQYIIAFCVIGYGAYVVYVNNVQSGKITAGNSAQLLHAKDPYNPFNLLMQGRSEMFIGWIAFMDKPLFGHGAWAEDPGLKYHKLYGRVRGENEVSDMSDFTGVNVIPTHSVIVAYGTYNGIAAFVIMIAIIYFFLKRGFRLIVHSKDRYLIVIASYFFGICWNSLFSPTAHFRSGIPLQFAFILVSYWEYMIRLRKERRAAEERLAAEHAEESNGGEEKRGGGRNAEM